MISDLYGLQVVGWYHSHPAFAPLPSVIDISNQLLAQVGRRQHLPHSLAHCTGTAATNPPTHPPTHHQRNSSDGGAEPYIAAIVTPYDRRLPSLASAVTWFTVEYDRSRPLALDRSPLEQVGGGALCGLACLLVHQHPPAVF